MGARPGVVATRDNNTLTCRIRMKHADNKHRFATKLNFHNRTHFRMDPEGRQDVPLLSPPPGGFDYVKVFPYIVHLKRDVIVSAQCHSL